MQIAATLAFTGPYHGWSYGINGELIDVPLEIRAYPQGCVNPLGANEVPCVESYKGLIFDNWDTSAPVCGHLGDYCRGIWMACWIVAKAAPKLSAAYKSG